MSELIAGASISAFLILTFLLALVFGGLAFAIGGANTFESGRALPFLLVTIWSPNIAALIVWWCQGTLGNVPQLLGRLGSPGAWAIALLPILIAGVLAAGTQASTTLAVRTLVLLTALNLAMGPLGEELGWRGFLLPVLHPKLGSVGAALAVGAIWAVWHAPLWLLPSPQRAIPFSIFFATVVCFSLIMTAAWQAGTGALWPLVMFHLAANLGVAVLELQGRISAAEAYRGALPYYAAGAALAALWLGWQTRAACVVS